MSGIPLAAPYLDTRADQLSFALGLPAREALAVTHVEAGGLTVELRLLGASHQVFAGPVRETLACLPGPGEGLPSSVTADIAGWWYRFASQVTTYSPVEFTDRTERLRRRLDGRPDALFGVFPGAEDALTALAVDGDTPHLTWRTWHTYPQDLRIVTTQTRLEAR